MQSLMQLVLVLLGLSLAASAVVRFGEDRLDDDRFDDDEAHNPHHKGHHHHHKKHHDKHHDRHHAKRAAPIVNNTAVDAYSGQLPRSAISVKKTAEPIGSLNYTLPPAGMAATPATATPAAATPESEKAVVDKVKQLEVTFEKKVGDPTIAEGQILVNGPLPVDFAERFAQGVSEATGAPQHQIHVTSETSVTDSPGVVAVAFQAPTHVVEQVENQAADPNSKLVSGSLRYFLVARRTPYTQDAPPPPAEPVAPEPMAPEPMASEVVVPTQSEVAANQATDTPGVVPQGGIDIDSAMPYGDLEPFGREDTAQELTESSVKESDEMVDQLERAEVAEEKRAVFRALTRLRGAAITSFDGVARSQTGNIDEYNKIHKWRNSHPLHHLADEESDIAKWAFPDNADFF